MGSKSGVDLSSVYDGCDEDRVNRCVESMSHEDTAPFVGPDGPAESDVFVCPNQKVATYYRTAPFASADGPESLPPCPAELKRKLLRFSAGCPDGDVNNVKD